MTVIKINEPGFEKFNGDIGGVEFVDGVSKTSVSNIEIMRISASMRVEEVISEDESGILTGKQLGISADLSRGVGTAAKVIEKETYVERANEESDEAEAEAEADNSKDIVDEDGNKYTKESLEKIADEKGISGIREIGKKFGVKGNSISKIISGIVEASEQKADK